DEAAPEPEAAEVPEAADVEEAAEPPAAPQPPPDPEPVEPAEATEPPAAGELASEEGAGAEPPAGPPAEAAAAEEGTDVAALVTTYLEAPSGEREGAADRIRARAEALRQDGAFGEVAAGVLELARAGIDDAGDGEALELAREILVPGVGTRIALDLGEVREEGERDRMIEIVARLGDAMAAPISEALADASDRAARRAYIEAMVALGSSVEEQVLGMIEDSRWFVVRNGVAVLGRIGDDRAIEHLTSTLAHEDLRVRRETVLALAKLGGENAGALALGMIDDPEAEVRAATAMALGELEMEKAVRPLRKRLEEEDDEDVQVQILRALGQLGDPGAVPEIEKHAVASFFSRPPRPVRIAAYKALSEIGTPHAVKLLEKALDDKDSEIRVAVRGMLKSLEAEKEAEATG
ncbi:MAG TPA: HEAT repeat domain-containing protein, partial [Longimicrobiales bacterium]|nr:HEAT repeat domain-containing protein [Longimicrobiales bacterium]